MPLIGPWAYRGLQLVMLGLVVHLLTTRYERFLQVNKCPYCKEDVPDGADLCPSCFKNLLTYQEIDFKAVLENAMVVFVLLLVVVFALVPYPVPAS